MSSFGVMTARMVEPVLLPNKIDQEFTIVQRIACKAASPYPENKKMSEFSKYGVKGEQASQDVWE